MKIDAKLWHQAKVKTGTRSSRKRDTKRVLKDQSAQKRIRVIYEEMLARRAECPSDKLAARQKAA